MQTLMSVVRAFLSSKGYKIDRRGPSLWTAVGGKHGAWFFQVTINEDDRWLVCRSHLPVNIPEPLRRKAAVFLARLNDSLIVGNWELDLDDGEVAFKTSGRFTEDELTPAMAEDLIFCNFSIFDRALPGFMALVHGRRSVAFALTMAQEAKTPPEAPTEQPQLPSAEGTESEEG